MASSHQRMDTGSFDGNEESSLSHSFNNPLAHGSSRAGAQTNIGPDGSNPWGLPKDSMVRLQQRVLQHISSRKNELHNTMMMTIHSTIGSALSLGEEQHKSLLDQFSDQFGFGDCTGSECTTYTSQPNVSSSANAKASGSAGVKVPSKEEQKETAKEGTKELVALFQHEARTIIDMAVDTMMTLAKEGKLNKFVSHPAHNTNTTKPASSMLSRSLSSKSNPLTNPFSQQTAPLADPATTVCMPHATFVAGHHKGLSGSSERQSPAATYSPVVTTFVSENSITEVTWLNFPSDRDAHPGQTAGLSSATPHSSISSHQMVSASVSRQTSLDHSVREAFDYFSFPGSTSRQGRRFSVPNPAPFSPHTPGRCRHASHAPVDCHITSFPPLPSRMQTTDWLVAPVKPTQKQENCATWYAKGIDARCAPHSAETVESETPRTRIFSTAPRNLKGCPASSLDKSKMGSSIGISSSRRRSPPGGASPSTFMDRIRRGSAQLGHALTSAVGITSNHEDHRMQRESSVTCLRRVLATIPQESSPDGDTHQTCAEHDAAAAAAAEAHAQAHHHGKQKRPGLTHHHSSVMEPHGDREISWRKDRAGVCATCSEDSQPHVCLVASGDTSRTVTPGVQALGAFV